MQPLCLVFLTLLQSQAFLSSSLQEWQGQGHLSTTAQQEGFTELGGRGGSLDFHGLREEQEILACPGRQQCLGEPNPAWSCSNVTTVRAWCQVWGRFPPYKLSPAVWRSSCEHSPVVLSATLLLSSLVFTLRAPFDFPVAFGSLGGVFNFFSKCREKYLLPPAPSAPNLNNFIPIFEIQGKKV